MHSQEALRFSSGFISLAKDLPFSYLVSIASIKVWMNKLDVT
jgi:hypothetical protein